MVNNEGVEIEVENFGDTTSLEYIDPILSSGVPYFNELVNFLVSNMGYVRSQSIFGAPYDFRKAPEDSYF